MIHFTFYTYYQSVPEEMIDNDRMLVKVASDKEIKNFILVSLFWFIFLCK